LSLFTTIDRWLVPVPDRLRVAWIGEHVFAHRGLHGDGVPENSMGAFTAAIARGLGIECDIQRSCDGQAMVFHDWELDRLTCESGPVAQRSAAELGQLTLAGSADPIPTLRQLLDQAAGRVPLLIEIKSRHEIAVGPVCGAVRRALEGYRGPHAVMSFDPRIGRWFAANAPQAIRGLVITEERDRGLAGAFKRHLALWQARPDFLAYDIRNLPSRFATTQRRRGLPVASWTVRSSAQRVLASDHADATIAEGEGIA
jgi:glycerophosphoryl diester phosphodiesterase